MRTAVRTALTTPLVQFDPDARDYITRVERADGQALETGVRQAIDAFVRGCKRDGIWEAIKASCILAGARTLSGALVPLKGTAPTNFNFVSGDYNRKTGLVGDGSTKYLNSNRAGNVDPQNNAHLAVHLTAVSSGDPGAAPYYISSGAAGSGAKGLFRGYSMGLIQHGTLPTASTTTVAGNVAPSAGLVGYSRTGASAFTFRNEGVTTAGTTASQAPASDLTFVFARNNASNVAERFTNARLAFYSIGESLDLALLDARVTTLVNSIASAIDGVTDTDARAYINAVENADGQALEVGVAQAYSAFITGCKSDGIWTAIKASCILAGARTLSGALVPLKGTAPTNFNFVSGDYNRKTGLVGNGSTKYLDSNRNNNADPQNSRHLSAYFAASISSAAALNRVHMGIAPSSGQVGASVISTDPTGATVDAGRYRASGATAATQASGLAAGYKGVTRTSSLEVVVRQDGSNQTTASTSETPASGNLFVFARNLLTQPADFYSNARLAFYSIGESLDLALLDARVTTLVNTLNSVIP